jgi:hypothetical protein
MAAAAHRYRADVMTADKGTKVTSLPRKKVMAAAAHRYRADVMASAASKYRAGGMTTVQGTKVGDVMAPRWLQVKKREVMAAAALSYKADVMDERLHPGTKLNSWTPSPKGTKL